jgi:hypothetical protein
VPFRASDAHVDHPVLPHLYEVTILSVDHRDRTYLFTPGEPGREFFV